MKLLVPITYYLPYVSGAIVYVDTLAEELMRRGHRVTVLTSRYSRDLPLEEDLGGVRVVRVPVAGRVSKGVLMPRLPSVARALLPHHDVMLVQAPHFESPLLAALARAAGVPAVLTYHCDVQLPRGIFNRVVSGGLVLVHLAAAALVRRIVATSEDYARHSPVLRFFLGKTAFIPPPAGIPAPDDDQVLDFLRRNGLEGDGPLIGICGRVATEKGFERLMEAVPLLVGRFPGLRVLHAGEVRQVIGERTYCDSLAPRIAALGRRWVTLGFVSRLDLACFFRACRATVLPSLNSTESFGMVQVESMLCGTPVVATDLPGVRVPVGATGMGKIVPPGDSAALAAALADVISRRDAFIVPRSRVEALYGTRRTADDYERLLESL
jgi:glycosyltransferase involved in cell wall biosynthesis